jgi:ParE toxin of type II toxin-antitoxin system, parDE
VSGYVLGRGAESDLDAIWEYIAQDNVDAADRWIGKLFDAFECLGQSPRSQTRGSDTVAVTVLGGGHVSDHLPRGAQSGGDCCSDAGLSRYSRVFATACALGRMTHQAEFFGPARVRVFHAPRAQHQVLAQRRTHKARRARLPAPTTSIPRRRNFAHAGRRGA